MVLPYGFTLELLGAYWDQEVVPDARCSPDEKKDHIRYSTLHHINPHVYTNTFFIISVHIVFIVIIVRRKYVENAHRTTVALLT